jgi:SAM-dependent methyltransferase
MESMTLQSIKSSWLYQRLHPRALLNALRSPRSVFSDIYSRNSWGGEKGKLFSGSGSRGTPADQYADTVVRFIRENKIARVLDLGCGDFFIGQRIAAACEHYIGVDVVPAVITHHQTAYATDCIEFRCLDIARDELPPADLCLVRQVFQHLSNRHIREALAKVHRYPFLIVTEHFPRADEFDEPNLDKAPGAGTRVAFGSAVCLDKSPFNLKITELLSVPAPQRDDGIQDRYTRGTIKTFLVRTETKSG